MIPDPEKRAELQKEEINSLEQELVRLKEQFDNLAGRVDSIETMVFPYGTELEHGTDSGYDEIGRGETRSANTFLPRLATVSFLLVFALILRTVTDNGMVNIQFGSMIGLSYAFALILAGWWFFARESRVAPVFPLCGIILLYSIVLEVHSRFGMISTLSAHVLLLVALMAAAMIGLRYNSPWLLRVGAIGSVLVGLSLDFPNPMFPVTGILLLAAIFIAFLAASHHVTRSLRWGVLLLVLVFWSLWGLKMHIPMKQGVEPGAALFSAWYLPLLFFHFISYFVLAAIQIRLVQGALGVYRAMLPSINATWAVAAGISVYFPWLLSGRQAGFLIAILAFVHLGLASIFAKKGETFKASTNAFVLAGVILLGLGLPFAVGGITWALPLWSVGGFLLALQSKRWQNGGVRAISYLFQIFACGVAILSNAYSVGGLQPVLGIPLAILMATMASLQYGWCRANKPPQEGSAFFSWLDKPDASAVVLLISGLIGGYAALRLTLHEGLVLSMADPAMSFRCGQTVLLNIGAAGLLYWSLKNRKTEAVSLAIIVGVFGAVKVFFYDMFTADGIPLIASVFSFGVLAALGSVATTRWQASRNVKEDESDEALKVAG